MASSFRIDSQSYQGRYLYLVCEQIEKNIPTATSQVKWTLTATGGTSSYYTTGPTTVQINGQTVYYKGKTSWSTHEFPAAKGSVSGVVTIPHDELGNAEVQVSITTNIYTGVIQTKSGTWTLDHIDRYATITKGQDFTDEENPKITYKNYAGDKVDSLQVAISVDGETALTAYRSIPVSGTSYAFALTAAEKEALWATTPNSNSLAVTYLLKTKIGTSEGVTTAKATMKIVNADPVVSPVIVDTNQTTIGVTGNSAILVALHSKASVKLNAAAQKKATISSKKIEQGDTVLTGDGTLPISSAEPIRITVKDSRGNVTALEAENTVVPYIDPTCMIQHSLPDANGEMDLVIVGSAYNGAIGKTTNAITVQYRHRKDYGDYSGWITISGVTRTGNDYTAQTVLTGLDYLSKHTFQARVIDAIHGDGVISTEKTFKAEPTFDWSEVDFQFHVPVTMGKGATPVLLTSADDLNDIKTNGWYYWSTASVPANAPNGPCTNYISEMRVFARSATCIQECFDMTDSSYRGCALQRTIYGDAAYDWEWRNPPMLLGYEFRTTERWQGKAVYTKLVNYGALPNASNKNVAYCAAGSTGVVSLTAMLSDGCVLSAGYGKDRTYSETYGIHLDSTFYNIRMLTEADFSSITAKVLIKYTKD